MGGRYGVSNGERTFMSTVLWEQQGPIGRIPLNRPETLNAWTAEVGAALRDTILGPASDPSVRAVLVTGAGRGFSSGADLKAGFEAHPDDGMPDVKKEVDVYPAAIAGRGRRHPPAAEARRRRGERAGGRHRLLAGAGLRPRARRRVGLLRAR